MPEPETTGPVFVAIADPIRRAILDELRLGSRTAGQLHEAVGPTISQPAFSQKLSQLRGAGLVRSSRDGRRRVYQIETGAMMEVARWALGFDAFWDDSLDRLGSYLDRKNAFKKNTAGGADRRERTA